MPRRRRPRKIVEPPKFKGYAPFGCQDADAGTVDLLYEEYEAIKLADYDGMSHHQACVLMGISRSTFARIYESARQKIAQALVEVKTIKSVYGNVSLNENWFHCQECFNHFTLPFPENGRSCPVCRSEKLETIHSK